METRVFWAIPIQAYSDEILKLSYLKLLGEVKFESVKLPTSLNNYKYAHLISPNFLLCVEVVKTKKNWILKSLVKYIELVKLDNYNNFLKISEINKLLQIYFHDEQEANILEYVKEAIKTSPAKAFDLKDFEEGLAQRLGFGKISLTKPQ